MADERPEDLTFDKKIQSVRSVMEEAQDDAAALRSGELKESTARILTSIHRIRMQGLALHLQAMRQDAGLRKQLSRVLGPIVDITPANRLEAGNGQKPKVEEKPEAKPSEGT